MDENFSRLTPADSLFAYVPKRRRSAVSAVGEAANSAPVTPRAHSQLPIAGNTADTVSTAESANVADAAVHTESLENAALRMLNACGARASTQHAEELLLRTNTPSAHELVGLLWLFNKDAPMDSAAVQQLRAADTGRSRAYAAMCKGLGLGTLRDHPTALHELLAAQDGLADLLAAKLVCLPGAPRDPAIEAEIFRRIAGLASPAAQALRGSMLLRGIGTRRKPREGAALLCEARTDQTNFEIAQILDFGKRNMEQKLRALRLYSQSALPDAKSAATTHIPASKSLYIYRNSRELEATADRFAESDASHAELRKAADLYACAATPSALRKLAWMYFNGRGVRVDIGTAFELCKRSDAAANPLPMAPPPPKRQRVSAE